MGRVRKPQLGSCRPFGQYCLPVVSWARCEKEAQTKAIAGPSGRGGGDNPSDYLQPEHNETTAQYFCRGRIFQKGGYQIFSVGRRPYS